MGSLWPRQAGPSPERRTVANPITPLANNDYQVFPLFSGTDNGCTNAVYLLPPSFTYGEAINLTVRYLYAGGADYAQYTYDNGDFQFELIPNQQGSTPQPPYQTSVDVSITLLANNMWKCAPSARQTLMSNFTDFSAQIESKFEIKTPVLAPGSASLIAGLIAEAIPAPLTETLFYRYGLNQGFTGSSAPRIDLLPGMRLRVEFEVYSFVNPGNAFNAYISSGPFYYYVSSVALPNNQRVLAFDAFLGSVAAPKIQPPSTTTPFLASGIIDMQSAGMARKYYRLLYPQNIIPGSSLGDSSTAKNVTLMGANTLAELNAGSGTSVINSVFRGRVEVVPEIPVRVGHPTSFETIYVPVGTTVNNLLERYTRWKPYYTQQRALSLSRLQTGSGNQSLGYTDVDFYLNYFNLPVADLRTFDLPLVHSDNLTFGF